VIPIKNTVAVRYPAIITYSLIAANCMVFLLQVSMEPLELQRFLIA
jgi:hypothetical protein